MKPPGTREADFQRRARQRRQQKAADKERIREASRRRSDAGRLAESWYAGKLTPSELLVQLTKLFEEKSR